jgi:hypothetical protein
MAMCFSLVALSDTPVTILDPKCTAKTFPDYFEQLARISTLACNASKNIRAIAAVIFRAVALSARYNCAILLQISCYP